MALHPKDKANAYSIGMLEQTIKIVIYDLEAKPPRTNKALVELKLVLATHAAQAKYYVESTNDAGQPVVPLPAS